MPNRLAVTAALAVVIAGTTACGSRPESDITQEIVALERAALDRWGKGDPQGYLERMAEEVTYFDPAQERRVDGLDAMKKLLEPLTGKVKVARFDMIAPKVQRYGDAAVLTFNIVSYVDGPGGSEVAAARWNCTEVYRRDGDTWKIAQSHWSYTKPELKQPPGAA